MKRSLIFLIITIAAFVFSISLDFDHGGESKAQRIPATGKVLSVEPIVSRERSAPQEIKENDEDDSVVEAGPEVVHYTEDEVIMMAKLLYSECRGVPSDTEKACVVWTVCNRVDSEEFEGDTITEVVTQPNQFAYYEDTPVWDELYELSLDVLSRWNSEQNGNASVGRVLPAEYTYYTGDGKHNYFRNAYDGDYAIWDHSLPSPYES